MVNFRAQARDVPEQLPTQAEIRRREALLGPVAAERVCQNLSEPSRWSTGRLYSMRLPDGLKSPSQFARVISRENSF